MSLAVTGVYAGLNALLLVALAIRTIRHRQAGGVSIGDGGSKALAVAIRAHGNAAEYIPIGLILLALTESAGAPLLAVHLLGVMLTAGRLLHALHFSGILPAMIFRMIGMALTFAMLVLAALGLVGHGLAG